MFADLNVNSIVFTSWCHTLNILARMLSTRGIQAVQIDGRVPYASRSMILSTFSNDPTIRVLLMSIGTGAVGYVESFFRESRAFLTKA